MLFLRVDMHLNYRFTEDFTLIQISKRSKF